MFGVSYEQREFSGNYYGICQNGPSARIPTAIIKWLTSVSDQEAVWSRS
jgi:hypothetical protein